MIVQGEAEKGRLLLAHGAGAGMESEFMLLLAEKLSAIGLQVVRFEFPYMEKTRQDGKRRPPDRLPKLIESFESVIAGFDDDRPLYLAGKSMGGRVATHCLEACRAEAAFAFGFPFHPAGKPDSLRTEHLMQAVKPVLVFQGTRDKLGNYQEVLDYGLPSAVQLHWAEDGDHDLKPRKASGFSQMQHLDAAVSVIEEFIR